jgi:hypothetical protein
MMQQPASTQSPIRNQEQLDALVAKRTELGSQLQSATGRRHELTMQLEHADPATARELMARTKVLDDRSGRIEREIMQADDAIAEAMARGITATPTPNPVEQAFALARSQGGTIQPPQRRQAPGEAVASAMFAEALVFVLLGTVLWRRARRRLEAKFARPPVDQSSRFDQLQQAVDVIALEVERISEGQRYVAKSLGKAVPVRTSDDSG